LKKITVLYKLRRWLFIKLRPKNLAVYCFKGMEQADGTGLLDLDTWLGWGCTKIVMSKGTYTITEYETAPVSPEKYTYTRACLCQKLHISVLFRQNS